MNMSSVKIEIILNVIDSFIHTRKNLALYGLGYRLYA